MDCCCMGVELNVDDACAAKQLQSETELEAPDLAPARSDAALVEPLESLKLHETQPAGNDVAKQRCSSHRSWLCLHAVSARAAGGWRIKAVSVELTEQQYKRLLMAKAKQPLVSDHIWCPYASLAASH